MIITKAIEIYLDWKEMHTNVAYSRYKVRLDQFKHYLGDQTLLKEITGEDIIHFHQAMKKSYSLATVAYSARILKNFIMFWNGRNETMLNPKEIIPIRYISADKDILTEGDFEDMCLALDEGYARDLLKKLVLHLLWDTGMRLSELCELKVSDLSNQPNKYGVRTAKVRTRKSMRYERVVWSKQTNDLLNTYLGIRLDMDISQDELLINLRTKKRVSHRSIQRWIKEVSELAMIDKQISPHHFRHCKAHRILDKTKNIRDVQAILRHVKLESSLQYLQLNESNYVNVAQQYLTT